MPFGGLGDAFDQLFSLFLLLPIPALGLYVVLGYELHIDIFRKPLLPLGVAADAILHAHPIDAVREDRVHFGSQIFYFFERLFLLLEHLTNLIFDIV